MVGLDISPTSLERAAENGQNITKGTRTRVELKCGDFFKDESEWETVYTFQNDNLVSLPSHHLQKHDFIFDYTFFCALPPSLRQDWGERMLRLFRSDDGRLFTIIFSTLPGEDRSKGPPYPVTIDDYRNNLEPAAIIMDSEPCKIPYTVPSHSSEELCCYWKLQSSSSL